MANEPTPNSTATAPASQDGWTPNPAAVQVAAPPPQQDGWTPNPATAQAAPLDWKPAPEGSWQQGASQATGISARPSGTWSTFNNWLDDGSALTDTAYKEPAKESTDGQPANAYAPAAGDTGGAY